MGYRTAFCTFIEKAIESSAEQSAFSVFFSFALTSFYLYIVDNFCFSSGKSQSERMLPFAPLLLLHSVVVIIIIITPRVRRPLCLARFQILRASL